MKNVDQQYVDRLLDLIENSPVPGKFAILAFDKFYDEKGKVDLKKTEFYIPNQRVWDIAQAHTRYFEAVISIHPYRADAIKRLNYWAGKGVKIVKWLPNAMGIDPSLRKLEPFYQAMIDNEMVLLTHGGEEKAVKSEANQKFGNPLLLRMPLSMGVKIIVAHCASLGQNIDLENESGNLVSNFDLFMGLMDDKKYEGLLFGDI